MDVSIIVPTLNEEANIGQLLDRVDRALADRFLDYEVIVVDDNSTDATPAVVLSHEGPGKIRLHPKVGRPGKAQSLLEGLQLADADMLVMIDADLQYPPEAIPGMLDQLVAGRGDIVVANRAVKHTAWLRTTFSRACQTVVGRWLWHFDVDVQSGLKAFTRRTLVSLPADTSPWTFDLAFLASARRAGHRISHVDIVFAARTAGEPKIGVLLGSVEIVWSALALWLRFAADRRRGSAVATGPAYLRGVQYVTHTNLDQRQSAFTRTTRAQRAAAGVALTGLAVCAFLNWHVTVVVAVSLVTALYFLDLLFNAALVVRSFAAQQELSPTPAELAAVTRWPTYTVLCPLYRESAVVPQFLAAMTALDYPKDRLDVVMLLEEDDDETIGCLARTALPGFIRVVVVPDSRPRTKPKACNYGLQSADGEYVVVYDAEDVPDPQQLKKAVVAFASAPRSLGCLQARLNYYNPQQNLLTRLFALEYALWFGLTLPGLQSMSAPIPLGGTSNHFRRDDLVGLGAWDPFNVTEDADLGMRIAKSGRTTAVLDSYTWEEANSKVGNWLRQRSRWIKGYMQTYLVHMRRPGDFRSSVNRFAGPIFNLVIGGKVVSILVNPLLWALTIIYFTLRHQAGAFIESFFPAPTLYIGVFSLVIGNALYVYYYMMGAARLGRRNLILATPLVPIYWLLMSVAALMALRDLIVRPFHWQKTTHGLHLVAPESVGTASGPVEALPEFVLER